MSKRRKHLQDLDTRGLAPRDKLAGDTLTLVSFNLKRQRRVSFNFFMEGQHTPELRRLLGWVAPSLDNDPPHPDVLKQLAHLQSKAVAA